jgi:hypothetical protein
MLILQIQVEIFEFIEFYCTEFQTLAYFFDFFSLVSEIVDESFYELLLLEVGLFFLGHLLL